MKIIPIDIANNMLPLVKPITEEIIELWNKMLKVLDKMQNGLQDCNACFNQESIEDLCQNTQDLRVETEKLSSEINSNIDEMENLGCMIENYGLGIVDFPSVLEGQEVMLCWQIGEEEIKYYHLKGESFKDRKLIKYEWPEKDK